MPGDLDTDARGMGPYLIGQPPTGGGIRNFPYSTDLVVSPLTYGDISSLNWPHGVGEVWAASLWEMYWNLLGPHGFDPDLYAGFGGNNLAIELVIDGMKLQPCNPTFVTGRDALIDADDSANGGANLCLIWNAFAKRGVGSSASASPRSGTRGSACGRSERTISNCIISASTLRPSGSCTRADVCSYCSYTPVGHCHFSGDSNVLSHK